MGHSYTVPVIKLLFATARTCAFPGCGIPLVFVDEEHGVREIAVQIAHIRSPKPAGPRFDPDFPADQLNSDENLLLLCGVHHFPVDRNESRYTTEEVLEWKEKQVAEGGGFTVRDEEIANLAARLESVLGELAAAPDGRRWRPAGKTGTRAGAPWAGRGGLALTHTPGAAGTASTASPAASRSPAGTAARPRPRVRPACRHRSARRPAPPRSSSRTSSSPPGCGERSAIMLLAIASLRASP